MTTRNLLVSVTALLLLATIADHVAGTPAGATEPGLLVAPAYALQEFNLTQTAITSSQADLRRVKNELRSEQRRQLLGTMARDIRVALDDVTVIAE